MIILTGGAFDPLHPGHIEYLRCVQMHWPSAKIVCAVATDAHIRRKGREPLMSLTDRIGVMRGVHGIAEVVAQTEDAGIVPWITRLEPNVYVVGSDYRGQLPEAEMEACRAHNVAVVYVSTRTHSSSAILRDYLRRVCLINDPVRSP